MSRRAFLKHTASPAGEREADAGALTKHCAYAPEGNARACGCPIEAEHDAATGERMTLAEVSARRDASGWHDRVLGDGATLGRGRTVPGTNAGSFAPKSNTRAARQLS